MAINRKLGTDDALDTVHLALQYKSKANGVIVGVDLSGDPQVSDSVPVDRSGGYLITVPFSVHVHHSYTYLLTWQTLIKSVQ